MGRRARHRCARTLSSRSAMCTVGYRAMIQSRYRIVRIGSNRLPATLPPLHGGTHESSSEDLLLPTRLVPGSEGAGRWVLEAQASRSLTLLQDYLLDHHSPCLLPCFFTQILSHRRGSKRSNIFPSHHNSAAEGQSSAPHPASRGPSIPPL